MAIDFYFVPALTRDELLEAIKQLNAEICQDVICSSDELCVKYSDSFTWFEFDESDYVDATLFGKNKDTLLFEIGKITGRKVLNEWDEEVKDLTHLKHLLYMSDHSSDKTRCYLISLAGRDDGVQFLMEVTEAEKAIMDRLVELANNARENEFIPAMCISDDPDDINEFLTSQND